LLTPRGGCDGSITHVAIYFFFFFFWLTLERKPGCLPLGSVCVRGDTECCPCSHVATHLVAIFNRWYSGRSHHPHDPLAFFPPPPSLFLSFTYVYFPILSSQLYATIK
jgi:hypothetical protein